MHKFTLRACGAMIGGLVAGLCLVFVIPMLTDVGQLCMLVALVSLFCAWLSTSSEAIAYAGLQIAFAFFLGILQGYGPATELTGLRDRVIGILIGNIWVTVVFVTIWPASALDQAASLRNGVLRKLGHMLGQGTASISDKLQIQADLSRADLLQARESFEWRRVGISRTIILPAHQLERIVALAFALMRLRDATETSVASGDHDAVLAERLIALSEHAAAKTAAIEATFPNADTLAQARRLLAEAIHHAQHSA